ncbi:MAG: hypothetical protein KME30_15100 [Iphinoe sp. HA4291-MV1]|jgi:hypothetical protein|nr:hypothetical protein [Iphinoe sp. HA4291-MV1]
MNIHIFILSLLTVGALNIISKPDNISESSVSDRGLKNTLSKTNFHSHRHQGSSIDVRELTAKQAYLSIQEPILQKSYINKRTVDDLEPNDISDVRIIFRSR